MNGIQTDFILKQIFIDHCIQDIILQKFILWRKPAKWFFFYMICNFMKIIKFEQISLTFFSNKVHAIVKLYSFNHRSWILYFRKNTFGKLLKKMQKNKFLNLDTVPNWIILLKIHERCLKLYTCLTLYTKKCQRKEFEFYYFHKITNHIKKQFCPLSP